MSFLAFRMLLVHSKPPQGYREVPKPDRARVARAFTQEIWKALRSADRPVICIERR